MKEKPNCITGLDCDTKRGEGAHIPVSKSCQVEDLASGVVKKLHWGEDTTRTFGRVGDATFSEVETKIPVPNKFVEAAQNCAVLARKT